MFLAWPRFARAADAAARVNAARGKATGLLNGAVRELTADAEIFPQELVQTEAKARLSLDVGKARLDLGERTRLKIEEDVAGRGPQLLLERGAIMFDRPDGAGAEEVVVRTPFALVSARGTRFFIGPSNQAIGVFVERGSASVRNNAGAVALAANEGTDLTSPDVAPTPPAKWSGPRIAAALASVT